MASGIIVIQAKIMHSWLLSSATALLILLPLLHVTGVGAANLTIMNNCSEPIWAVVQDSGGSGGGGGEVGVGRSLSLAKPDGWNGRVWGKTGCLSNGSNCTTGDDTSAVTLAEFSLTPSGSAHDFYDVSLLGGYNLPLAVEPTGGSTGSVCGPTGCIANISQICPPELRGGGGGACRGPCAVFGTAEYCCTGAAAAQCGPTNYSRLFKQACPRAYSYPVGDDATSLFSCTAASHYFIAFCPSSYSFLPTVEGLPPAASPAYPPQPNSDNNPPRRKSGKNRAKDIITMVSVGVIGVITIAIAIVVAVCCFFRRRQSSQTGPQRERNRDVENLLLQHGALATKRYNYAEIKKMTKSLSDKLGEGGFGSVYKGSLPDGRLVAVKLLSEMDSNGEEFMNEVASISRTSHVNIVTLLGFCYEGSKRALVYEYMPNKSLDKFLGSNGDLILDLNKLYEIAVGIARGLQYLHTGCTTRIVHFDIKPQNILLDEDMCPKISDFGLAKLCKKKQSVLSLLGTRGTVGYIAPEVFSRTFGGVSHKSDVYSFGMMLLEMAGAKKDGGTVVIQSSENYFPDKIYEKIIIDVTSNLDDESMVVEEEEEKKRKMTLVGFWCIQTIPSERPSISKVAEMLEGSLVSIQIPPKPFLSTPVIPNQETSSTFSANVETLNVTGD